MAYGQKKGHVQAKRVTGLTLSYIFLAIICVFWVFPFVYLILQSIRGESTGVVVYILPKQVTFQNYINLFTNASWKFGTWYLNTLIIAIFTAVIQTIIVLLTAYALSRMRFKGRTALMKFMLIIGMFPGFLSMVCIYFILKALNLQTSVFGLVLVYCSGAMMGYYICKGFFDTISKSLDEAAMIDGASRNTIFWKIIMPLSKPIVIYTILTSFLGPWGDFMMANFLVARGSQDTWTVAVGMQNWLTTSNLPYYFTTFCAAGVVVSIVPTILFFFMQRFYVEGVTGGAVKG
jgi:arabinogalactan oligomer / maltooligosaccharide transport system permease protein